MHVTLQKKKKVIYNETKDQKVKLAFSYSWHSIQKMQICLVTIKREQKYPPNHRQSSSQFRLYTQA